MASWNYVACLSETLKWEGGWSNHPSDPGGATMRGVIQRVYDEYRRKKGRPLQSVRNISEEEVQEIYRKQYWDAVNGDSLEAGVDLATFDFGVNSGPSRAKRYLMSAIGGSAINTIKKLCGARLSFVRGLGTFSVFGKGWTRRITGIEAKGVAMALAAAGMSAETTKSVLKGEAEKAKKTAVKQTGGAVATTTAPAAQQADPSIASAIDWSSWLGIAVAVVGVAVVAFLIYRAYINKKRADAYKEAANELG